MRPALPPGQQLAAPGKWPVVGERLPASPQDSGPGAWTLQVHGLAHHPHVWRMDELQTQFPIVERVVDIHCVTRWSMLGTTWRGVELSAVLKAVQPTTAARFISFVARSPRRHSTSLPLDEALRLNSLIVWSWQGEPLSVAHGGPLRMVAPGKYFYKSVKWLDEIELLAEDRLGYWEGAAGYHNGADPWLEQRFVAPDLSKAEAARILSNRDWSSQVIRGLDASQRTLNQLIAVGAVLRDASFADCQLVEADFSRANLSGSRFWRANLRGASFAAADIEGVDFRGADLRGVDFRDASLLGVVLCDEPETPPELRLGPAIIDATTRFDASAHEQLAPSQATMLRS
jgi:DMSO/TMAO reductase YedYZ molybdopterin-dependent catalytic subunit